MSQQTLHLCELQHGTCPAQPDDLGGELAATCFLEKIDPFRRGHDFHRVRVCICNYKLQVVVYARTKKSSSIILGRVSSYDFCFIAFTPTNSGQVLADDRNQDMMRSMVSVFSPFRDFTAQYEACYSELCVRIFAIFPKATFIYYLYYVTGIDSSGDHF